MSRAKSETIRRLRLGDLRRLVRARYGPVLPDDDAGWNDLREILFPISLGAEPADRMMNAVEVHAPWVEPERAKQLLERITSLPMSERMPTAAALGERMRLTNAERERLRLWTLRPFDMTEAELAEQRKAKKRERDQRRRRLAGAKPRAEYLAASISRQRPWENEGVSRRTWYRTRANAVAQLRAKQTLKGLARTCATPLLKLGKGLPTDKGPMPRARRLTDA